MVTNILGTWYTAVSQALCLLHDRSNCVFGEIGVRIICACIATARHQHSDFEVLQSVTATQVTSSALGSLSRTAGFPCCPRRLSRETSAQLERVIIVSSYDRCTPLRLLRAIARSSTRKKLFRAFTPQGTITHRPEASRQLGGCTLQTCESGPGGEDVLADRQDRPTF